MTWLAYPDPGSKDSGTPVLTYVLIGVAVVVLLLVGCGAGQVPAVLSAREPRARRR